MNRIFLLGLLALAAGLIPDRGALATFGDCMDPAYIDSFDGRPSSGGITCVERLRLPVATAEGERHIRIIQDVVADWAFMPGVEAQAERGVRATVEALGRIGSFKMDDVTVLLLDDLPPTTPDDKNNGVVAGETGATVGSECRVVFYLFDSRTGDPEILAANIAHEIFHCVQFATLSAAQMASGAYGTGSGGDWWMEGSAEWFANLAVSDSPLLPGRIERFETAVETAAPLDSLAYSAVVFFMWLDQISDSTQILPFLHQMADSSGASAQRAAMRRALDAGKWQRFAQDYLDENIRHPRGDAIAWSIGAGKTWRFEENRVQPIEIEPFVLSRGWIEMACGTWHFETRPERTRAAARRSERGADWSPLARDHDTEREGERLRFAALSVEADTVTLQVDAERRESCEPCAGSDEVDACIVGAWKMTGGGPVEWMRRQMPAGVNMPVHEQSDAVMVFKGDGTYWTAPFTQRLVITMRDRDGLTVGDGKGVAQGAGRWSIKDGRFYICQDAGGLRGQATLTSPHGSTTLPMTMPGAGTIDMSYSCSDANLETRMDMPTGGPMTTSYGRISRPPE